MAHRSRSALIAASLGVALAAAAPSASARPAVLVPVRAHVSYTKLGSEYRSIRLTITRGQRAWTSSSLGISYFQAPRLTVRDLDADAEPEVWVDTYSGGAHCCLASHVFRYSPAGRRYLRTDHGWGNVGYRAKNVDGREGVELLSYDDRFAYTFTAYAASFFPLRIWHFDGGRLRDVTRLFPGLVAHDANELWNRYLLLRRTTADVRGVLAAWLADTYLLSRQKEGWASLDAAYRHGELGPSPSLAGWPQGRAYLTTLRVYLRKLGYATGPTARRG